MSKYGARHRNTGLPRSDEPGPPRKDLMTPRRPMTPSEAAAAFLAAAALRGVRLKPAKP